jgi:uncharacterized protein YodC (DUF2158 family)
VEPGTTVTLNSGGPVMTVVGKQEMVLVSWLDDEGKTQSGYFAETSLTLTKGPQ